MVPRPRRALNAPRGQTNKAYVYIQMPGTTSVVTCGLFAQTKNPDGTTVGSYIYGRQYRNRPDAVPLDPYHLPLSDTTVHTAKLNGIFGALRDASPDAWGRRIIERELGRTDLTEIDYLLNSPEDRAGALSFGHGKIPPPPVWAYNRVVQLSELLEAAALLETAPRDEGLPATVRAAARLLEHGTSLGGARPKAVVEDEAGLWVAKFPASDDKWNNAAVEAGLLALARRCGIGTPETRVMQVGSHSVLLVQRFDRALLPEPIAGQRYLRHRMVSALTVLEADDAMTARENWSYVLFAQELQRWSRRPDADRRELFRRMVFNALVSNLDDHPRNHALIAPDNDWHLAPAYDITPHPRPGQHERELAMVCGSAGRWARRANLVSRAGDFALTAQAAAAIVDELVHTVAGAWEAEIRKQGASVDDCAAIAAAFLDAGFEYDAPGMP